MDNIYERALAGEILAEAKRRRVSARTIQARTGVSSSAFHNYFVACNRHIPMQVVIDVAAVLGLHASDLMRRAEDEVARRPQSDPITAELEASLSPRARRGVEQARAQIRQERTGAGKKADPPEATGERTPRSA